MLLLLQGYGAASEEEITPVVRTWTLRDRDTTWTLFVRDTGWSLRNRDTTWTVDER